MSEEVPIELYRTTNNEFIKYVRYDDYKKLENIIKEVRDFAKLRKEMYERQENVVGQEVIISLLSILDKGE